MKNEINTKVIENAIEELTKIKELKEEYDWLLKNNNSNVKELFEFKLKDYKNKSKEELLDKFKNYTCRCCRSGCYDECNRAKQLSKDIKKPILRENKDSGKLYIAFVSCEYFEWD